MRSKLNYLTGISLKRKIKTKWFVIANVVLALLIIGVTNIDSIINIFGGDFNNKTNVYVIDETNISYDVFESQLKSTNNLISGNEESNYNLIKTDKTREELTELIKNNEDEQQSIILEFKNSENTIDVVMTTKEYIDLLDIQSLTTALNNTKSSIAIMNSSISEEELNMIYSPVNIERMYLDENKNSADENMEMVMTTVFPIIILPFFMLTIFLVQMIGAEVNDEKTTRGMEIIISNVSPKTHFFSKVIAGNLFVILQGILLIVYALLGMLVRKLVAGNEIVGGLGTEVEGILSGIMESGFGQQLIYIIPLTLILMLVTFLAYSLLAGILASMTTNTEDFQQLQTPIMVISLVGYYLSMVAGMFEGSLFIKIFSFIPFISAILSPSLLVLGQIGIIEVIISIVLVIITVFLLIKYGLKIYKVGILNYSSKDLWKKMFKALKN